MGKGDFGDIMKSLGQENMVSPTWISELEWLYRAAHAARFRAGELIIDCGTFNGVSAAILAQPLLNAESRIRIVTIDDYSKYPEGEHGHSSASRNIERFEKLGLGEYIRVVDCDDLEFLRSLNGERIASIVFVDSKHSHRHVFDVLTEAIAVMIPGGLLCGHDYCWTEPGVVSAVDEWRQENAQRIFGFGTEGRIWWTIASAENQSEGERPLGDPA